MTAVQIPYNCIGLYSSTYVTDDMLLAAIRKLKIASFIQQMAVEHGAITKERIQRYVLRSYEYDAVDISQIVTLLREQLNDT
jgi:hypothetical protein